MKYKGIKIVRNNDWIFTIGLANYIQKELKISVHHRSDEEYFNLICYLIDYASGPHVIIKPDETIAYHSWILQFVLSEGKFYQLWEAEQSGKGYHSGVDYAIYVVHEQENECSRHKATSVFPTFSQNIVISKGVYEGLPIEGIRYPSPKHMTGWWLITDEYDDNVNSLQNVHYSHVAFKRPDILKYLALPFGYRFFADEFTSEVWYDDKIK
jgi:hypothetical protein